MHASTLATFSGEGDFGSAKSVSQKSHNGSNKSEQSPITKESVAVAAAAVRADTLATFSAEGNDFGSSFGSAKSDKSQKSEKVEKSEKSLRNEWVQKEKIDQSDNGVPDDDSSLEEEP